MWAEYESGISKVGLRFFILFEFLEMFLLGFCAISTACLRVCQVRGSSSNLVGETVVTDGCLTVSMIAISTCRPCFSVTSWLIGRWTVPFVVSFDLCF